MIKVGDLVKWNNTTSKVRELKDDGSITIQAKKGYGNRYIVNINEVTPIKK